MSERETRSSDFRSPKMAEQDYEDDFEAYDDDEFEEDEEEPPVAAKPPAEVAKPPPPARSRSALQEVQVPTGTRSQLSQGPWSLITLQELELGAELARGAFSRVHAGTWRGRSVAVKLLTDTSSEQLKACEEELQVHAALGGHTGIVRLHGANLRPPDCCIVMERCRFSLFERLHAQSQDLDRREMVNMAAQVADAMAFLHAQSPPIVHRDLKSHNVLLDDAGKCKLCDFGLVGTREVTAGTPNYMAPELFQAKPYSASVDVFAFAVLLNELFTREVPWDGYQPMDIKAKVVAGERPRTPKTMPSACEGLVRKAWHKLPSLRPSFPQLLPTLRAIEESLPLGAALYGTKKYSDSLDDFAMLGLNRTV